MSEAVAHLTANLQTGNGQDAKTVALTQSLVEISFSFYSQRQLLIARTVGREALNQASPLLRATRTDDPIPELYFTLGQLDELILFDLPGAQGFYQASLVGKPNNGRAQAHLKQVQDKIRKQTPGRS